MKAYQPRKRRKLPIKRYIRGFSFFKSFVRERKESFLFKRACGEFLKKMYTIVALQSESKEQLRKVRRAK